MAHPPDANPRPTVVFRTESAGNWASDNTNANIFLEILPLPNNVLMRHTLNSVGAITALGTANVSVDYTALSSSFSAYRPMVMSVEVEYVGEQQLAKGTLALCVSDNAAEVGWTLSQMVDEPYYKEISVSNGGKVAAVARYSPQDFYSMNNTTLSRGSPRIFVLGEGGVTGASALQTLRVRVTLVNEYLCPLNSILQTAARHSPYLPGHYAAAQSMNSPDAVVAAGEDPWKIITRWAARIYKLVLKLNGGDRKSVV